MEMPYVFDHLSQQPLAWAPQDRTLASVLPAYWTNFATTGDPNGPGLPTWPDFRSAALQVMVLGDAIHPEPIPDEDRLRHIGRVYATVRFVSRHRYLLLAILMITVIAVILVIIPMFVAMVLTIVGHVTIGVPVMPDEIDRLAAGVVLAAVMAPIALIAWAYMQLDRPRQHTATNVYAHDRRAIDEAGRRRVADIHASVKAGFTQADGDRHLCECCAADCQRCKARGEK